MAVRGPTRQSRPSRRERERDIVAATRALFDERGLQDAPIEDIARAVGINKALIYRHFGSKEELFVQTLTLYLDELAGLLRAIAPEAEPVERLRRCAEIHATYCLEHPAYLDCALSLMRRPAAELRERVSDAVWLRLGQGMAECLGVLSAIVADGAARGDFAVDDPDLAANLLYTRALGTMHLARIGVGVRRAAQGIPEAFAIDPDVVRREAVADAVRSLSGPGT